MFVIQPFLTACALMAGATVAPDVVVEGGGLRFGVARATGHIRWLADAKGKQVAVEGAGLEVLHGAKPQPVGVTMQDWQTGRVTVGRGRLAGLDVDVTVTYAHQSGALRIAVQFVNRKPTQRLLEVRLVLPVLGHTPGTGELFDGFERKPLGTQTAYKGGLGRRLPVMAVCTKQAGTAIGIEAADMHGWMGGGVRFVKGTPCVELALRRVLDPNGKDTARFVAYAFDPTWGTDAAVDRYYDLYAWAFRVPDGVDPRVSGVAGYIRGTNPKELIWEESRRVHHSWQPNWGFRRTGDWMPTRELWPANAGDYDAYIQRLRTMYTNRAPGNIIGHYLEVCQCEAALARQRFRDCIRATSAGPTKPYRHPVPVILGESCHAMFPYKAFYRAAVEDVGQILGQLNAPGIYIDNASGLRSHFGVYPAGYPARAFDSRGKVYSVSGVGTAGIADLAHRTRTVRGCFAPITCNGVGSYLVAFRVDSTIHEGTPWEHPGGVARMRRLMGGKTMCWWEDHLANVLRWRALSPVQIIEAMRMNVRYCLLYGLRWGVPPAVHVTKGRAESVKHLPLVLEVTRTGWRPLVPVKADPRLWVSRFGTGLGTILTVSNPTRDTIAAALDVDSRFLNPARDALAYLFAYHEKTAEAGTPLANRIMPGGVTRVRIDLAPKAFRVLRAAAVCRQPTPGRTVRVSEQRDAHDRLVATADPNKGVAVRTVRASVEVRSTVRTITDLPWLAGDKPQAVVLVGEQASVEEKRAAARVAAYFEYWLGRQAHPTWGSRRLADPTRRLPVVTSGDQAAKAALVVIVGTPNTQTRIGALKRFGGTKDGPAGVIVCDPSGTPPTVRVGGRTPADVEPAVMRLLDLLDKKYPPTWALSSHLPMWKKAGVAGKEFTGRETPPAVRSDAVRRSTMPLRAHYELPAGNLLANGGFEHGDPAPTGWSFSSPNQADRRCRFSTDAREGRRAAYVPGGQYMDQRVALKPGRRYRYSLWRKMAPRSTVCLCHYGIKADGNARGGGKTYIQCQPTNDLIPLFLPAGYFNQPGVWQHESVTIRAPDTPTVSIRLYGWGEVLIDAVSLVPVQE